MVKDDEQCLAEFIQQNGLRGAVRSGSGFMTLCPAHDDHRPSLSVGLGRSGKVLLFCHAGCKYEDILNAMGLERGDLQAPGPPLEPIPFEDFRKQYPSRREAVVEGIVREGETANIIGTPKVGKSWLAYSLALSVANGWEWLGRFHAKYCNVLLIDDELHPEELRHRIDLVADEMQASTDGLEVLAVRGQGVNYATLRRRMDPEKLEDFGAVLVDCHYRMLPQGTNENDNSAIKDVYNLIDQMAGETRAAWFLVHHTSKGSQGEKEITDVGAGAGAQSRAADAHLVVRPHSEDGVHVMEVVSRSFPPVPALAIRWQFPLWLPDEAIDPRRLRTQQSRLQRRADEADQARVRKALAKEKGLVTANVLAGRLGIARRRCLRLLESLVGRGVVAEPYSTQGNETTGYRLAGLAGLVKPTSTNMDNGGRGGLLSALKVADNQPPSSRPRLSEALRRHARDNLRSDRRQ